MPGLIKDVLGTAFTPFVRVCRDRRGLIVAATILLLFFWGQHGNLDLIRHITPAWCGLAPGCDEAPARLVPGLAWDQILVSFLLGGLLLVAVPCLLIRYRFRQRLADYGLGWVAPDQRRFALATIVILLAACVPAMIFASTDDAMRAVYPFWRDFGSPLELIAYELAYLVFFIVIEFVFRGWLLFGLDEPTTPRTPSLAIFVSALVYTVWHYGKPLAELGGTLVWGIATGALILRMRSIWPIVLVHWVMNLVLDLLILRSSP